jgi:hypothetical protein
MDAWRWDKLYDAFAKAMREGDTQWVDPLTGVKYFLPTDAKARATLLDNMDKTNLAILEDDLKDRIKKGMATKEATNKYLAARDNYYENKLWLLTNEGQAVDTAGDLMRDTEDKMKFLATSAQAAIEGGDYETAWELLRQSNMIVGDPRLQKTLEALGAQATATERAARDAGVYMPEGLKGEYTAVTGDLDKWLEGLADKAGIEDVAKLFDPKAGYFQLDPQGNPITHIEADGSVSLMLAEDVARVYNDGTGKIELKKLEGVDRKEDGTPDYALAAGMVGINLKTGGKVQTVLKKYSVGTVGYMVVEGKTVPIKGKVLTITMPDGTKQTLANDPFDPDNWVDITKGTALRWRAPAGTTQFSVDANGNISFILPKGAPSAADILGGALPSKAGQGFQLRIDPKTGTYQVYATDPTNPESPKLVLQTADAAASLLGGPLAFRLDTSNLSPEQKLVKNMGLTGAFVGMGAGDILDYGIGAKGYAQLGITPGLTVKVPNLPGASALGTIIDKIAKQAGGIVAQATAFGNLPITPARGITPSGRKKAGVAIKPPVTMFDIIAEGQAAAATVLGTVGIDLATPTLPRYTSGARSAAASLKPIASPLAKKTLASQTKARATTKKRAGAIKSPTPRKTTVKKATAKKGQIYSPIKPVKPVLTTAQRTAAALASKAR